jgi:hypothetical protein
MKNQFSNVFEGLGLLSHDMAVQEVPGRVGRNKENTHHLQNHRDTVFGIPSS